MDGTVCELRQVRDVGPNTVALEVSTPAAFAGRPGQFVQVAREIDGEAVVRHYSISSPVVADTFELTVTVDPDGTLSPLLADASEGETLLINGPFGRVFYEDETDVTAVAAGPGIGPALGVAERAIRDGGSGTLVYATEDGLVHERRLTALSKAGGPVYVVSTAADERLRAILNRQPATSQLFVYGFEPFVTRVTAALKAVGVSHTEAKIENFG